LTKSQLKQCISVESYVIASFNNALGRNAMRKIVLV